MNKFILLILFIICSCNNPMGSKAVIPGKHTPYLEAPASFIINSVQFGPDRLSIGWTQSSGANFYSVKYREHGTNSFVLFSSNVTSPFTITGLDSSKTYYFLVEASNPAGTVSSNQISGSPLVSNTAPGVLSFAHSAFGEDSEELISLPYLDLEGHEAISCSISDLNQVLMTSPCLCTQGVCTVGIKGLPNFNGPGSFKYSVSDHELSSNIATVSLTISPVNDAPSISSMSNVIMNEDGTAMVDFTISDIDSNLSCSESLSFISSSSLFNTSAISFTGSAPNCRATLSPLADQSGTALLTFIVNDGQLSSSESFSVTVNAVNDAPVISSVANQTFPEDTSRTVSFSISDIDSNVSCSSSVTVTSSNGVLLPVSSLLISGDGSSCSLVLSPQADSFGSSFITLRVSDGILNSSSTFLVNVTPVNDAPTISSISAKSMDEDGTLSVTFFINDIDSSLSCSSVTATSSDLARVPNANLMASGNFPDCDLTVRPLLNQFGNINIALTVTDGSLTASTSFALTINSVPDLTGSLSFSGIAERTYSRMMSFTGLTLDENIDRLEICISEDVNLDGEISSGEKCNVQTWLDITSVTSSGNTSNTAGWTSFRLRNLTNGANFSHLLEPTCSSTRSYITTLRVRGSLNGNTGEYSSPAWSFWLPSCESSLAAWYDVNDSSTVFSDASCTTPIVNNNQVACIRDKSTHGRHVYQEVVSRRPLFLSSSINSRPALTFSNSSVQHLLTGEVATWLNGTPYSSVAVINGVSTTSWGNYFMGTTGASQNTSFHFGRRSPTELTLAQYSNDANFALSESGGTNIHIASKTGLTTSSYFYHLNGSTYTPTSFGGAAGTSSNQWLNVNMPLKLGSGHTDASHACLNGKMGEAMIFTSGLNLSTRQKLDGYLAWKWGTESSLPSSHPFKSNPP